MGAEEIYQFLKKHQGHFYSTKQLIEKLDISQQTTSRSLNIISRYNDIVCEYKQLTALHTKINKIQFTKRSWVYAYVKKNKEMIKLVDEPEESNESDIPQSEKDIKERAKDAQRAIKNTVKKVKDVIETTAQQLGNVKTRTINRRKQLQEAMKHTHKKQIVMGHVEWLDEPPREVIGELSMTINGSVGKVRYVRYLKDPETGYALKQASKDGTQISGNIISHYVEEIIAPGQSIERNELPIKGCPNAKDAKEAMESARNNERKRIAKARGII